MSHRTVDIAAVGREGPGAVLHLSLLGSLSISRNGEEIDLTGPKRRALLILLALHAGTPVSRERIVDALWPERRTGREESTLQVHISHLRDEIEPNRGGDPSVILTRGSAYMLAADAI
ncbi:MAG: helix-turn-helix domain-containing protein, partial [Planctomycetota bacterium]